MSVRKLAMISKNDLIEAKEFKSLCEDASNEFDHLGWEILHNVRDSQIEFRISQAFFFVGMIADNLISVPETMDIDLMQAIIDMCNYILLHTGQWSAN